MPSDCAGIVHDVDGAAVAQQMIELRLVGRLRVALESSLRHDIARNYYLSLNLYESYGSDTPERREKSDLGVPITFGRSF